MRTIKEEDIDIENYFGCVYKTIFPNGKIYVGYTQHVPGTKKFEKYFGSGTTQEFIKARRKYVAELEKEIIHVVYKNNQSFEDLIIKLCKYEKFFQLKTKCLNPNIGYNVMFGNDPRTKGCKNPMNNPISRERARTGILRAFKRIGVLEKYSNASKLKWADEEYRNRNIQARKNNGNMGGNKGKINITNGDKVKVIYQNLEIPEGWWEGGLTFKWLTNGKFNMYIRDNILNPKGYVSGRIIYLPTKRLSKL